MAGATCTACGQANPDGAKCCNECGAPLARFEELRIALEGAKPHGWSTKGLAMRPDVDHPPESSGDAPAVSRD